MHSVTWDRWIDSDEGPVLPAGLLGRLLLMVFAILDHAEDVINLRRPQICARAVLIIWYEAGCPTGSPANGVAWWA